MKPTRRGRPPLGAAPKRTGRSPVVRVPVKEETLAALQKLTGDGIPLARVARRILEKATKT